MDFSYFRKNKNLTKLWLPVLLWMGLIFFLSSRSNPFIYAPSDWQKNCQQLLSSTGAAQEKCQDEYLGRVAHVGEYGILALLLYRALSGAQWELAKTYLWTLVGGLGYGLSDEFHQLFVPGRAFMRLDLALDLAGVVAGITFVYYLRTTFRECRLYRKLRRGPAMPKEGEVI
jgi:VanZ family protein